MGARIVVAVHVALRHRALRVLALSELFDASVKYENDDDGKEDPGDYYCCYSCITYFRVGIVVGGDGVSGVDGGVVRGQGVVEVPDEDGHHILCEIERSHDLNFLFSGVSKFEVCLT